MSIDFAWRMRNSFDEFNFVRRIRLTNLEFVWRIKNPFDELQWFVWRFKDRLTIMLCQTNSFDDPFVRLIISFDDQIVWRIRLTINSFDELLIRLTICQPPWLSFMWSIKGFHSTGRPDEGWGDDSRSFLDVAIGPLAFLRCPMFGKLYRDRRQIGGVPERAHYRFGVLGGYRAHSLHQGSNIS